MTDWLVSTWTLAMLTLLPLCAGDRDRLKTWAALLCCSAAGWLVTPRFGVTPFLLYILIDAVTMFVIARHPASQWQKLVGTCFLPMLFAHFGVLFSGRTIGGEQYLAINYFAGWLQFAILATWGTCDGGLVIRRYYRRRWGPVDSRALASKRR